VKQGFSPRLTTFSFAFWQIYWQCQAKRHHYNGRGRWLTSLWDETVSGKGSSSPQAPGSPSLVTSFQNNIISFDPVQLSPFKIGWSGSHLHWNTQLFFFFFRTQGHCASHFFDGFFRDRVSQTIWSSWSLRPEWLGLQVWATGAQQWTLLEFLIIFLMLGMEHRTLHVRGRCSTTEPHCQDPNDFIDEVSFFQSACYGTIYSESIL
jgi:hypothetical protein